VARVVSFAGARFHAIGDGRTPGVLGLEGDVTEWVEFDDYPAALAGLDIGLVPLADTRFNRAKSGLKLAELAAAGVAAVASPTPDNRRLADEGIGLLADRPQDWERQLRRLAMSSDFRQEVVARSRAAMAAHTVEANSWKWLEAWHEATTSVLV
jgi:glycosyltransferase involved in cell wall biosynthesis